MERKLVTIRKIKDITDIEGADRIKLAIVDGWKTITKTGEFNAGEYGVYFEIDSLIPLDDERFEFIKNTKNMDGVKSRFIKTIRLRGQISQGLVLPIQSLQEIADIVGDKPEEFLDRDFADVLGVLKYEEPDDTPVGSAKSGSFPEYMQKTGENRIQNVFEKYSELYKDVEFYPTLKMDGSSMTIAYVNKPQYFTGKIDKDYTAETTEQLWVASHRLVIREPKPDSETGEFRSNAFYEAYYKTGLEKTLPEWCERNNKQIAIQGELLGPKISKNFEKFNEFTFRAFYVYFIDEDRRATPEEFDAICKELGVTTVKVYPPIKIFQVCQTVEEILEMAEGVSENNTLQREGLVFKANVFNRFGKPVSFKAISNTYLLGKK